MEWFFTLVLVRGAQDQEDKFDSATFGWLIRKITKTWRSG